MQNGFFERFTRKGFLCRMLNFCSRATFCATPPYVRRHLCKGIDSMPGSWMACMRNLLRAEVRDSPRSCQGAAA